MFMNSLRVYCYLIFWFFIVYFFSFLYKRVKTENPSAINLPVVLQWNDIRWTDILPENLQCPKKCNFTKEIKYEDVADVIIFYTGYGDLKMIPKHNDTNRMNRMNVFVNFDPPTFGPYLRNVPKDFFNYTVTYRPDSNLPMPYDCLKELEKNDTDKWSDDEVEEAIAAKNKSALFLVSHCKTDSNRELIVDKISKIMNITQIGECNNNLCPRDEECEKKSINIHYFILAFENSVCLNYISEKAFRLRQLIVPVILDRSVLQGELAMLNPYVIAVSDFKTIKDLVGYLKMLMENKNKYRKYFEWTKKYKKTNKSCVVLENIGCKMCDLAWDVRNGYRNIIQDGEKWYKNGQCKSHFGKSIV